MLYTLRMPDPQPQEPEETQEKNEKEIFSWSAPSRAFVQREREFWVKVVAVCSIFGLILFIVEGAMPVILMISIIFLFYVLSTVRPENIEYKITNLGIKLGGVTNYWDNIGRFWFSKKGNDQILVLDMTSFSGRLELVVNSKEKDKIREIVKKYIPEEEAPQTRLDKAGEWIDSKLS